jgi:hypothetical protein
MLSGGLRHRINRKCSVNHISGEITSRIVGAFSHARQARSIGLSFNQSQKLLTCPSPPDRQRKRCVVAGDAASGYCSRDPASASSV